ncbi:MAG: GNAT family N-acetyltransferase [Pseudomonadota bacterium]
MHHRNASFHNHIEGIGDFLFVPYDNENDAEIIHPWVNMDYAKFWMLGDSSLEDVKAEYRKIMEQSGTSVFLGYLEEKPVFLTEIYNPAYAEIMEHYEYAPRDIGMHVLVAPPDKPIRHFTRGVFISIMKFIFAAHSAERVIVDPDTENHKIHKLNEDAGFRVLKDKVTLSNKTSRLECCTRYDFEHSKMMTSLSGV